ncbi:MAG: cytidine deaminase [Pseudomonadota bacterium]
MTGPEDLWRAALEARKKAHAAYSGFQVGCALRTESGKVFLGANMENTSYPEGWCAETSAIAHMVMAAESADDRRIAEVVVVAELDPPVTPCGGCRQRLAEFGAPSTMIHAGDLSAIRASWTLAELLPAAFRLDAEGEA